jgi:hypothetical protein
MTCDFVLGYKYRKNQISTLYEGKQKVYGQTSVLRTACDVS